jgi:hypothetical protein
MADLSENFTEDHNLLERGLKSFLSAVIKIRFSLIIQAANIEFTDLVAHFTKIPDVMDQPPSSVV